MPLPYFPPKKSPAVLLLTVLFLLTAQPSELGAQDGKWSLSGGLAAGFAPSLTHGSQEFPGPMASIFADLEFKSVIGRLRADMLFPDAMESSFTNNLYLVSGAIGYNFSFFEKLKIPMMVSGGAALSSYTTGLFGSDGDTYYNVSPQIGLSISPYYQLTRIISIQAGLRFLKGFEAGERTYSVDVNSLSLGIRFRLF